MIQFISGQNENHLINKYIQYNYDIEIHTYSSRNTMSSNSIPRLYSNIILVHIYIYSFMQIYIFMYMHVLPRETIFKQKM